MSELKTLKDIIPPTLLGECKNTKLKAEAVNQYKAIDEKKCKWTRQDVLNWIKYFFNLTEEDLK